MNPLTVLLWFIETFHIENWGQLEVWLVMVDLLVHFVTSSSVGCGVWWLTRSVSFRLFSMVVGHRGVTRMVEISIYLFSFFWALFASVFVHCWLDFGWDLL